MQARLTRLRTLLHRYSLPAFLISKPENLQYYSGFTGGTGLLLVSAQWAYLIVDFRYIEQAQEEASACTVLKSDGPLRTQLMKVIEDHAYPAIGFEDDFVSVGEYRELRRKISNVRWEGHSLENTRAVKDTNELAVIKKAIEIADAAFSHVLQVIQPGVSEREIAADLEYTMRRLGADKPSFDTIVASGTRSSMPHGAASDKKIAAGDFVTMDFGALYRGYCSDITRTVVVGRATEEQRRIYNIVLHAQLEAIAGIHAGMDGQSADAIARNYIAQAGYENCFGHALGHGVGLQIHEEPRLSVRNTAILEPNMVVTVEPGLYIPGWGGVRIEDVIVLRKDGCEVLTASDKSLIEIH